MSALRAADVEIVDDGHAARGRDRSGRRPESARGGCSSDGIIDRITSMVLLPFNLIVR